MKTIVQISAELEPAKRSVVAARYPEGQRREYGFEVWLSQDDPRVSHVLAALGEVGYRQWDREGDRDFSHEYYLNLIREYEPADFADAEYVEFWPEWVDSINSCERDEQGRLGLERPTIKNARRTGLDFATATLGEPLVVQRVRDILQEGDFRHMVLRPTVLVRGRGLYKNGRCTPIPWEQFKVTQPWWELASDLVLPPLSPKMDLRNWGNHEPLQPDDRLIRCFAKEGLYNHAELHYRRSDLAKLEPFDVAQTYENFGPRHSPVYNIIVSKRFYDYCVQKGLKGRWVPVRIDEEG